MTDTSWHDAHRTDSAAALQAEPVASGGGDWASWRFVWHSIENVLIVAALTISTGALVALGMKFSGGPAPWTGLIWAVGAVLCIALAAVAPWRTLGAALAAWPVLLVTVWVWASVSWSVAPYDSIRGAVYLTAGHILAFTLAARLSWLRLITLITWVLTGLMIVSFTLIFVMPQIGRMQTIHPGAWSGVFAEKQLFGVYSCHFSLAVIGLIALKRGRTWWWLALPFGVLGIIGATGRTAMLMSFGALFTAMAVWLMHRGGRTAVLATWAGIVAAALVAALVFFGLEAFLQLLGRSSDFTGRSDVWEAVTTIADQRPLTGWGYQSIWRGAEVLTSPLQWIQDWTDFEPANAHSSFLDAYIQLGSVGVGLLILALVWIWWMVLRRLWTGDPGLVFGVGSLTAVTFVCFTETVLLLPLDFQWILLVAVGTKMALDPSGRSETAIPWTRGTALEIVVRGDADDGWDSTRAVTLPRD